MLLGLLVPCAWAACHFYLGDERYRTANFLVFHIAYFLGIFSATNTDTDVSAVLNLQMDNGDITSTLPVTPDKGVCFWFQLLQELISSRAWLSIRLSYTYGLTHI